MKINTPIFRYYDSVLKQFVTSDTFKFESPLEQLAAFFNKAATYAYGGVAQQWTGMKDRLGNMVFEGDILAENITQEMAASGESANISRVFFAAGTFMLDSDILYNHFYGQSPEILEDYKVVGNIFENPELLK